MDYISNTMTYPTPSYPHFVVGDTGSDEVTPVVKRFRRGEVVFHQGDECAGLLELVSGLVKLTRLTPEGRELVVRLAGPGDVLEPTFLDARPRFGADACCVTDEVTVRTTCREDFLRAAEASPGRTLSLVRRLAGQMAQVEVQLELSKLSAAERVAWVLAWLTERFGTPQEAGWVGLELHLTHEELAVLSGTSRVTVTTCLGDLRGSGVLRGTRGHYAVRRLENLYPAHPPCVHRPAQRACAPRKVVFASEVLLGKRS